MIRRSSVKPSAGAWGALGFAFLLRSAASTTIEAMLALSAQSFAVILITAGALGYLLVLARRSWRSGEGSACGGCHSHGVCSPAVQSAPKSDQSSSDSEPHRMFLPVENFADAAKRHRESIAGESPESRS